MRVGVGIGVGIETGIGVKLRSGLALLFYRAMKKPSMLDPAWPGFRTNVLAKGLPEQRVDGDAEGRGKFSYR